MEAAWFMDLLSKIDVEFPERPRVRNFQPVCKTSRYNNDGFGFGFRKCIDTDKSTGSIVQLGGKEISAERARTLPVIGEPWVQEWYTRIVGKVFGVPADMLGVRHVVGSVLDANSATVRTHAFGVEDYWRRRKNQGYKRVARDKERTAKEAHKMKDMEEREMRGKNRAKRARMS